MRQQLSSFSPRWVLLGLWSPPAVTATPQQTVPESPTLAQPNSSLVPLLSLKGHTWNTPLRWEKDMDMPSGSKQARDWHHANQGGINMNYFAIIQYCLHAEAQRITASIPHSVFLTRLQWGSSSAHCKPFCSSTTGTGLEHFFWLPSLQDF